MIVTIVCQVMFSAMQSQAQTKILYDTIPFEIVQDKLIITASIDGQPVKMILDTGGQNTIVADSAKAHNVQFIRSQTIADVNDARIETYIGSVSNFRVGRWMKWDVGKVTVIPGNPFFRELGVAGTVGAEFFSQVTLAIDRRNKRIIISHPYRPAGISRADGIAVKMDSSNAFQASVPVRFGDRTVEVLFDSGAGGFLSLSDSDYAALKGIAVEQETGHGLLYVGAAGIGEAVTDTIRKVSIPVITLPGGKVLENVGTLVGNHPATIAGQKLFDYGIAMFDYPRGLFYFLPYEDGASDVADETRIWNVRILPMVEEGVGLFRVVATIGDTGIANGERVWEIGGVDLAEEMLSENTVNGLLENVDTAVITVGEDKREVEIRKI